MSPYFSIDRQFYSFDLILQINHKKRLGTENKGGKKHFDTAISVNIDQILPSKLILGGSIGAAVLAWTLFFWLLS